MTVEDKLNATERYCEGIRDMVADVVYEAPTLDVAHDWLRHYASAQRVDLDPEVLGNILRSVEQSYCEMITQHATAAADEFSGSTVLEAIEHQKSLIPAKGGDRFIRLWKDMYTRALFNRFDPEHRANVN